MAMQGPDPCPFWAGYPPKVRGDVGTFPTVKHHWSRTLNMHLSSKTLCLPLLVIIFFNHALLSKGSRHLLEGGKYYRKEVPIKTITVDDGDVYDCMKLDSQPRKRNPSIIRKIQSREKPSLHGARTTANNSDPESSRNKLRKPGALEKGSCPPGSFPVLKATKAGLLNFSVIESFASLRARSFLKSNTTKPLVDEVQSVREYATASVRGGSYAGAEGTLSIWQPTLEHDSEMSLSQIWVASRTRDDFPMSLEAGWMNDGYTTWLYNDNHRSEAPNNRLQFRITDDYLPLGIQLDSSTINGDSTELEIVIKQG
ncbi:hypothetical protein EJ110_NYTH32411 [Nymphaea thermarum]|nr:hypothetical protein EJ110_NYTH32411 [Nymphaea thermarum]